MRHVRSFLQAASFTLVLAGGAAEAQSLSPMRGQVVSFSDRFALRLTPGNPYDRPMTVTVAVYDEGFRPIRAAVLPARQTLGPGHSGTVTVVVPFAEGRERRVRVCARARPVGTTGARIVTEVCGRYRGTRHALRRD